MSVAPDDHLGDRLSALLDGELADHEVRDAHAHLEACETCRVELEATASARSLLRDLPAVGAPFGFYERMLGLRGVAARRRGIVALASGAAAAVALLALATPSADRVDPTVGDLVERHAATASAGGDPVTQFVPLAVPVRFEP